MLFWEALGWVASNIKAWCAVASILISHRWWMFRWRSIGCDWALFIIRQRRV